MYSILFASLGHSQILPPAAPEHVAPELYQFDYLPQQIRWRGGPDISVFFVSYHIGHYDIV